jgi:magnesium-transporting ATPase (P-type)
VETALYAGIDVRMIPGDHPVTAHAVGEHSAWRLGDQRRGGADAVVLSR